MGGGWLGNGTCDRRRASGVWCGVARTGDLDVLVGNDGQANQLLLSNGDGTFAEAIELPGGSQRTSALSVGDVDGDGALAWCCEDGARE